MPPRVTVRSRLGSDAQSFRTTIEPLDLDEPALILPYNPETWRVTPSPKWVARGAAGAEFDRSEWEGNAPRVLTWRQRLRVTDAYRMANGVFEVDEAALVVVENIITTLERWATRPSPVTDRPTLVIVTLGDSIFQCHIARYQYTKLRVDARGRALVADVDIALEENF